MNLVVADTGPIRYLLVIGSIQLLPKLYDRVFLPRNVHRELTHLRAPDDVRRWALRPPTWVEIREVERLQATKELDTGEADAISLAQEMGADWVLLDEREGRDRAVALNLRVLGNVGVLELAAERGLVDLNDAFAKLRQTNFRIAPQTLREALGRDASRRATNPGRGVSEGPIP